MMTTAQELARFSSQASYDALSAAARRALKIHILDALGCGIGALGNDLLRRIRAQVDRFSGAPLCTLIGGGKTAPDQAAFYNGALVRYLDFNDSYLAPGETCHPSDSLAPVLAAAEYADASGPDLLAALAVAYQIQCRLSEVSPVRAKGFDHTTQAAFAMAAGVARALGIDADRTANAIAISGTVGPALRVTRTGALSHWKGLAAPHAAFASTHAAFLAAHGITGPAEVFEGNKGFMDAIAGRFRVDWAHEDLERVTRTVVKKYNAEIHAQSAIEGLLELQYEAGFRASDVHLIGCDIFRVAYHIIGGGEEGRKTQVRTKEEADHSLPYLLAVGLLDGTVMPEQFAPARIARADVQELLRRVRIRPVVAQGPRFPAAMPCRLGVRLRDGRLLLKIKRDYEGFVTRPIGWDAAVQKFERLAAPHVETAMRRALVTAVETLEDRRARELTHLLGRVKTPQRMRTATGEQHGRAVA